MKKILLASTALIGLAGAASAEVAIEGYAEMGISGGDEKETQFHNSYNINFVMSGETDTGLSFGATYRLDADDTDQNNQDPKGDNGTVWISGAFGRLTLGDTDGALDWALTEVAMGTTITDEGTTHVGYSGNSDGYYDDQVLRYQYAFGDFGVALSVEMDDNTDSYGVAASNQNDAGDPMIGIGGKYSTTMGGIDLGFGLGIQSGQSTASKVGGTAADPVDVNIYGVSASASMDNGFSLIGNYVEYDVDGADDFSHYAVGAGYETGPLLLHANWGKWDYDNGDDLDSWAALVNYDLGGGAILAAGYASDVDADRSGDQDQFSLGLSLSF